MKQTKQPRVNKEILQGLPAIENAGFNQTIIINNSNFNANFINQTVYNQKLKRDNHNKTTQQRINPQLKCQLTHENKLYQFSGFKQHCFLKTSSKTKSNIDLQHSPYLPSKAKIKDTKQLYCINLVPSFRQNRTISTINRQPRIITTRQLISNSTIEIKYQTKTSFRKHKCDNTTKSFKFNSQLNNNCTILQHYFKGDIEMTQPISHQSSNLQKINLKSLGYRRNKFSDLQNYITNDSLSIKTVQGKIHQESILDFQDVITQQDNIHQRVKTLSYIANYNRSKVDLIKQLNIQKMQNSITTKMEHYFQQKRAPIISNTKILQCATVAQQPTSNLYTSDDKNSQVIPYIQNYEFQFKQGSKKEQHKNQFKRKQQYEQLH